MLEQLLCLAEMVYFEARSEAVVDQIPVAYSAKNRAEHSSYPNTLCEVVHKPYAYSYYSDGKPETFNNKEAYGMSLYVSFLVITNIASDPTEGSTHYHHVHQPAWWAIGKKPTRIAGFHVFYNNIEK